MANHQIAGLLAIDLEAVGIAHKAPQVVEAGGVQYFGVHVGFGCGCGVVHQCETVVRISGVAHTDPLLSVGCREDVGQELCLIGLAGGKLAHFHRITHIRASLKESVEHIGGIPFSDAQCRVSDGLVVSQGKGSRNALCQSVPGSLGLSQRTAIDCQDGNVFYGDEAEVGGVDVGIVFGVVC